MIGRRSVTAMLGLALAGPASAEDRWVLVTPEEVQLDRSKPHGPELRGLTATGGPKIEIERPDVTHPVHAPVTFRIRFLTPPGVTADLKSFKVLYGWMGIDITARLLTHASLTPAGLSADNADIPPGDHRVTVTLADTGGRVSTQTFHFTVVA